MQIYYIELSRKSVLDAYMWQNDPENMENGSRVLHIFPAQIRYSERGLTQDDPYSSNIEFVQSGNWYGPDVDESKISMYDLDDLFDEKNNSDFSQLTFNYSETRADAREHFAQEQIRKQGLNGDAYFEALREFKETVEECHLNKDWKYYEEVDQIEDEWVDQHVTFNRETAASALVDELMDDEQDINYKIVWMD
jgi:hypothetical protein